MIGEDCNTITHSLFMFAVFERLTRPTGFSHGLTLSTSTCCILPLLYIALQTLSRAYIESIGWMHASHIICIHASMCAFLTCKHTSTYSHRLVCHCYFSVCIHSCICTCFFLQVSLPFVLICLLVLILHISSHFSFCSVYMCSYLSTWLSVFLNLSFYLRMRLFVSWCNL